MAIRYVSPKGKVREAVPMDPTRKSEVDDLAAKIKSQWAKTKQAAHDTVVKPASDVIEKVVNAAVTPSPLEQRVKALEENEQRLATIEKQLKDAGTSIDSLWTRVQWLEKEDKARPLELSDEQLARVSEMLAASAGAKMAAQAHAEQMKIDKAEANRRRQKEWRERQKAARNAKANPTGDNASGDLPTGGSSD